MNYRQLMFGGNSSRPSSQQQISNTIKSLESLKVNKAGRRGYDGQLNQSLDDAIRYLSRVRDGKPVSIMSPVSDFKSNVSELREQIRNSESDFGDYPDAVAAINKLKDVLRRNEEAISVMNSYQNKKKR